MFRITKTFENSATRLYRIEGKVTDEGLSDWNRELNRIIFPRDRQVILDFCGVWFFCVKAVEILLNQITEDVFVVNCGMELRNVFHASGLSARMLE
jgi:hypothetical protein